MLEDDPLWYKDAIIYELPVKSFFDGNGDGVGDFPGLISKLDYLQDLGVNTLWLLPFYLSPMRDDGYDIADYHKIDPVFGKLDDFRHLVQEAHNRKLRVITELVINHTSDAHPWFQTARQSPRGSVKRDYYVWSDTDTRYAGTRIIFTDTESSNWTWDDKAGAFYWHRFFSHQPDLNYANEHVFKAMMKVMRFWFDAGVDGMRLDGVPYLCEREGTSSENLPETHAVVKRLRAELDKHYKNRMFLAEANQWPEDVREYFADGDECHMAYHFPLMPRMYMAIAQEDRHPITEIMEQTPDIPDNCQWAIFLRNHDELTLEMVTDRERDYLYQSYAIDQRARLNLGIRRRLASLLDNDRHRIELMNLLLMTMPGSPVLYYGDEIGMGDNIQLGDRDGVRTPMQWSSASNGGFSDALPNRLYLPAISDPVYGFGAVNVEAQERNPSSLLNWMRRLIAMRKEHPAFGRGNLRFLRPGNRKILAYLREHEGESILCVANLARTPQAVELELGLFKGRVPVELMGRSKFPPIGDLPYLLTLGGHAFFGFRLAADVDAPAWHEERPLPPDLPVLVLAENGWQTLFGSTGSDDGLDLLLTSRIKDQLEGLILPQYFRSRPWFQDRNNSAERFGFDLIDKWTDTGGNWLLTIVRVMPVSGEAHRYAMPLALEWGDVSDATARMHVTLAKVRRHARVGSLYDAFWDDNFCVALVSAMERGDTIPFGPGVMEFRATRAHAGFSVRPDMEPFTRATAERGRLRVTLNGQLVLKSYRRLLDGTHPELEVSRFLTETAKFEHIPLLAGTVEYRNEQGQPATWAILERYIENQGDARDYSLNYLERYLDECHASAGHPADMGHTAYLAMMHKLGQRTAQFHQALALADPDGAFGSEPIRAEDLADWVGLTRRGLNAMFELLTLESPRLPAATQTLGAQLTLLRAKLYRRIVRTAELHLEAMKTRYHGDYHLGQIWIAKNDLLISNYSGEQGLSWSERRRRHSVLRDIADLLLSLSEVGITALDHVAGGSAELRATLQPFAREWEEVARRTFLASYRRTMRGHASLPQQTRTMEALLNLFMAEKAIKRLSTALEQRSASVDSTMRQLIEVAQR